MISFSDTEVDAKNHEVLKHGTTDFPIACYFDDLQNKSTPWHWHEELEAGIVITGSVIISTPARKVKYSAGDGFFINSGILHAIQNQDSSECHIDSLVFHPRLIGGNIDSIFWKKYVYPVTSNSNPAFLHFNQDINKTERDLIQSAWMECVNNNYGFEVNVRYFLSQLLVLICQRHLLMVTKKSQKVQRANERIKIMHTYIEEHFNENITVHKIANSASISESECIRCFRDTLGTSPIAYLKTYRLQKAAEFIISTNWKLSFICQQCGFHEMSYFSKSFRESYHCTPSEYRRHMCFK